MTHNVSTEPPEMREGRLNAAVLAELQYGVPDSTRPLREAETSEKSP